MYIKQLFAIAAMATLAACNSGDKSTADADNGANTTVTETTDANETTANADGTAGDGHADHDHAAGGAEETHKTDVMGAGPHQGIIVHASSGHMEMALDGKDAAFYPLDGRTEPVDANGWTGSATVQYEGGDVKNVTLKNKNGGLVAEGTNTGKTFKAIVTLNGNGTTMTATFNTGKAAAGDGHSHDDGHRHSHDEGDGHSHDEGTHQH